MELEDSISRIQKILDRITAAWNANEPDAFDKFWSIDFADHGTRGDFGLEALRRMHTSARKSFSIPS